MDTDYRNLYELKPRAGSGILYAHFTGTGRRLSTRSRNEADAHAYVEALISGTDKAPKSSILEDFAANFFDPEKCEWLKRQKKKGKRFGLSNQLNRRSMLTNHILPKFGHRAIETLRAPEIEDWLLSLERSNSTINQILFTFRIVLKEAVRQDLASRNEAKFIEQLVDDYEQSDVFSDDELSRLFPADGEQFDTVWERFGVGVMAYVALVSGARHGELRALKWSDVKDDAAGSVLVLTKTVQKDGTLGPTKNRENRITMIDHRARRLLSRLWDRSPQNDPDSFVFTANGETPWWTNYTYKYFKRALDNAEIQKGGNRVLKFHSFRHTYVTRLRRQEVNEQVVQSTVGHSSAAVTDIYDHKELSDRRKLIEQHREAYQAAFAFTPDTDAIAAVATLEANLGVSA